MRRSFSPFLLLCCMLLSACEDRYSGWLVLGGVQQLDAGELLEGELILFDGSVVVARGARINGSVYMLGGDLQLDGAVAGDISLIDGRVTFAPGSIVLGSVRRAGGEVTGVDQARIDGGLREGAGLEVPLELTRTARPPRDVLLQSLVGAILLGLAAAAAVRFMPAALVRVAHTATRYPLVSASLGLLVAVVGPALMVMMAFTVILIPLALISFIVAGLIVVYGWVSLGSALGSVLASRLPPRLGPSSIAFLGTLLFMLLLGLVELIPVIGTWLALLLAIITLGAVLLTRFGTRTFVPANDVLPPFTRFHEN